MDTSLPLIILVCGLLPLAMGGLAIIGWYTRSPCLVQLHPRFVPMQFNTALSFLICGISLLLLSVSETQGVTMASSIVLIVGALTLFQYLTQIDCRIDQLFLKHYITVGTSHPGRMAPNTALCFILTALAFLISASPQHSIYQVLTSGILGASIFAFGAIALMGYVLQVQPAYGWGYLTKMAIPTALGFGCIGVGLLAFSCCVGIPLDITVQTEITVVVFSVGIILASLLTLAVYYLQRDRQLMRQLQTSHQSLQQEVSDRRAAEHAAQRSREELRNLTNRLQLVREEEKTHIAREIHDELGQTMTALKIDLMSLEEALGKRTDFCREKIREMSHLINDTVHSIQRICFQLRPKILDLFGLKEAMESQVQDFEKRTGIQCVLHFCQEPIRLDQQQTVGLFRVFQETLSNVARHAKATAVRITFTQNHESVELVVTDDGIGITSAQTQDSHSLGLIGMRERILHLGGTMNIQDLNNQGTKIHFTIPRKFS